MAEDGTNDGGHNDDGGTGNSGGDAGKTFSQVDLDRIVADRVARERAKYADYGDLKKKAAAAMTDQEKAVSEAEQRGKTEALTASSGRLARAEFRAAAAGRVDKATLDAYLEDVDLNKFIGADGEPDLKAIESRVSKLGGSGAGTDFDGGARGSAAKPTDMNQLIRHAAGLG